MPHLVILYSANLDAQADMGALCHTLRATMLTQLDDDDVPVFPPGGVRVLAYPAPHFAVADGRADAAFVYLNLRMAEGRSVNTVRRTGDALSLVVKAHFADLLAQRKFGVTLQIDEGPEAYNARLGNLHALFAGS
jgi:5-carboxymethyl-2-hydroxymuconate isomerase